MASLKNHPGMWLRDDAAAAINALEDKYGVIEINSAGRYEWEQQELIDRYDAGDRTIYMPYRPAAGSPHVRDGGTAVDIYNYTDDRAKMEEFGFQWTYGDDDPVHYDYIGWSGGGALEGNQRRAGSNGVRARRAPSTSAEVVDGSFLAEGEVGTFAGYVTGENVDGENRWAKGAFSGLFFWLGGLTPQGVDGLPLLDAPKPTLRADQRQADADGVKGRQAPNTAAAQVGFLDPNDVGDFNGWAHGQSVDGEDRWLRGAYSGAWFWLGGLSPRTVDGLTEVKPGTTPPVTTPPTDERVIYPRPSAPTYPEAVRFGHSSKCEPRKAGASPQVLVLHWWGDDKPHNAEDEWLYFTGWQIPLGSSPTWQANADGSIYEVVPPDGFRPWTTGQLDHWAMTVECEPIFTDALYERLAKVLAFAHERYGIPLQLAEIRGTGKVPVIAKGGLTSHKLTPAGKESGTKCPGDLDLDRVLRRAIELATPKPDPKPDPGSGLTPEAAGFWQWLFDAIKGFFNKRTK